MKTPYIGFFRRTAAFIIDLLLVTLVPVIIIFHVMLLQTKLGGASAPEQAAAMQPVAMLLFNLLGQLLFLVTYWLYFALFESSAKQATLGKQLLHIKVVDQQGQRLTFWHATGRALARWLSYLILYIGFIMAGCTRRNRALHDMIAKTYVVRSDFQPQDELPDTPGHPVWLTVWIIVGVMAVLLPLALMAGLSARQYVKSSMPVMRAVAKLQELAKNHDKLATPLQEDGAVYYRHKDGYRAVLNDEFNNTLFLQDGTGAVCCEQRLGTNCIATELPICE